MSIIQRKFSDFAFDPTAASAFPEASLPSVEEEADAIAHEQIDDLDNVEDDFGKFASAHNSLMVLIDIYFIF